MSARRSLLPRALAFTALVVCGCMAEHLAPLGPLTADRARSTPADSSSAAPDAFPSSAPSSSPPRPASPPAIREAHLHNGVRVLMYEQRHFPIAGIAFVLGRGDADVDRAGVMDLFFRGLTSGSDLVSAKGLHTDLYALGAQRHVSVHTSYCGLELTAVSPVLNDVMRIEASTFVSPIFDGDDFDEVLQRQQTSLKASRAFPANVAKRTLMKMLYPPTHPNGQDASDSDKPLDGIKVADIRGLKPLVGSDDVSVVTAGNFNGDALLAELEKALGGLSGHATPARNVPDVSQPSEARVELIDHPGDVQVQIALGFVTVKHDDPDYPALMLASRLLGRESWRSMRLSHGLTYGGSSSLSRSRVQAPFLLTVAVEPTRVEQALRDSFGTLTALRDYDKNPNDLVAAKQVVDASWPDTFDTIEESLESMERIAGFGLPADAWSTLRAAVQNVSAQDLKRVAEKYLDPAHAQLVLVGDAARLRPVLATLGLTNVHEQHLR